jgi:hypothetical protein
LQRFRGQVAGPAQLPQTISSIDLIGVASFLSRLQNIRSNSDFCEEAANLCDIVQRFAVLACRASTSDAVGGSHPVASNLPDCVIFGELQISGKPPTFAESVLQPFEFHLQG